MNLGLDFALVMWDFSRFVYNQMSIFSVHLIFIIYLISLDI